MKCLFMSQHDSSLIRNCITVAITAAKFGNNAKALEIIEILALEIIEIIEINIDIYLYAWNDVKMTSRGQ